MVTSYSAFNASILTSLKQKTAEHVLNRKLVTYGVTKKLSVFIMKFLNNNMQSFNNKRKDVIFSLCLFLVLGKA